MQVPLEISYRQVNKTEEIDRLVHEKAQKLERVHHHISSCRVAIEKPQKHQTCGNPYRVRIDITVPPGHEIVVRKEPSKSILHRGLDAVIRSAFSSARRQLKKLEQRQRGKVKTHSAETENEGIVKILFREKGYGFVRTLNNQDIYFHENSVLNDDFKRLEIGTGVRYEAQMGEKGLQASTVQIVDKPGSRIK